MLWLVLIVLLLIVIVAAVTSNGQRANVNSQAEYERLRRLSPDDPLASVGPNEFDRAYAEVREKKAKTGCGPLLLFVSVCFVIGPALGWLVYDKYEDNTGTSLLVWLIATGAAGFYWYSTAKAGMGPPTRDEIAAHLGLDG